MPIYEQEPQITNLLLRPEVCHELRTRYQDLKDVVMKATEADCMVPAFSATLEYIKEVGSTHMPTSEFLFARCYRCANALRQISKRRRWTLCACFLRSTERGPLLTIVKRSSALTLTTLSERTSLTQSKVVIIQ